MKFIELISTFFFIGYLPAGGTFATLATLPLILLLSKQNFYVQILFIIITFLLGVKVSSLAEKYFNKKDDRRIVIDEVVGFLVAMVGLNVESINIFIIALLLFRFFDITKVGFKKIQKISSGLGIMTDDIIAGLLTNIILRIFL
ncbi:MAG: phosphatidylglycerophosphatase A [Endomicrobiia bacterium]